ncbi:MAG: [FeFe] hydrogenase, group A [Coriobacteriales bacterium]|jgi:NADH-quinone oxidoreductase subunit G|nr:[FeFe] hydrogenase, group A [Coriobacteriales bacterium]
MVGDVKKETATEMIEATIDGVAVKCEAGTTILDAARQAGINIFTLCYLKDINEIGACRACVVEVEGYPKFIAACNNVLANGMVIHTNSPVVRSARKANVELILSEHDARCASCVRSGNCALQSLANDLGIVNETYPRDIPNEPWPRDYYLQRDGSKCIKCMRCVQICHKVQSLDIWDVKGSGGHTTIGVSDGLKIDAAACSLCGQCVTHCPVGALHERDDTWRMARALADKNKTVMVQIAPAVRAAWGEHLGLAREQASVGRLVAALRKLGVDYVFDTDFSADLTIMEEGSELVERLGARAKDPDKYTFPMFTSCCPGWIRFIKTQYPDMVPQLSSAKSPQQMFGAVAKTYWAEKLGKDPADIFSVSVMPCLSKKSECDLPYINASDAKDVDMVLTTREIDRLIRADNIDVAALDAEDFDAPLGVATGAGVIFGATGGVMEAALRSAYFLVTGKNPGADAFLDVRGQAGWKEATFDIADITLKVAVASGLGNTRRLIEAIRAGEVSYDFVEIMACPGGCAGGGGQPIWDGQECAAVRADVLYGRDKVANLRFSHENPSVKMIYDEYVGAPGGERAHELLHTGYPTDIL